MAQLGIQFDSNQVDPDPGFDLLPPADYRLHVVDSDVRSTKDGQGRYVWVEMDVLDGPFAGRKLWHNFNILNPSDKAQQIGQSQLSALCHAIGVGAMTDSEDLHLKPFIASVGVRPAREGYEAQNRVKSFKPASGGGGGIASQRSQGARQTSGNGQAGGGGRAAGSRPGSFQGGKQGGAQGGRPWQQGVRPGGRDAEGPREDEIGDDIPF